MTDQEQAILDAFNHGKGVGYVHGMRAEREACMNIVMTWYNSMASEPEMLDIYNEIKARSET